MSSIYYIGRPPGSSITGTGTLTSGQMRVCVFNRVTQHLWLRRIGARRGVSSGSSVDYRYVAYRGASDHTPDTRIAYVGLHTTNVGMSYAGDGSDIDHAIDVNDTGPETTSLGAQVWDGWYIALGIECTSAGTLMHGTVPYADLPSTVDETDFFKKTGVGTPPNPYGSYSTEINGGHMSVWAECDTNDPPEVPINRTADTSTGDLTPTLKADFRDRNGTYGPTVGDFNDGDRLNKVQIQFRRQSDNNMMWDTTYSATDSEGDNDRSSRQYTGTTLVRGIAYEWRIRHQDQFNEWGDFPATWLAYTPTATAVGVVTIAGGASPTGKQDVVQIPSFAYTWSHNTGLSTNAVRIRLKRSGTITQTSGIITQTTTNGSSNTISWAQTGFNDLYWGSSFTYAVQGRDTANVWSEYSNEHPFTTNKAPTTPGTLSPNGPLTFTAAAYPKLTVKWSDVDDTTGTGLTGTIEITRPDLSTVNVTPTYNAGTDHWEFQTTATQITIAGVYQWRARSFDGTLYSGGTTSAGSASWSGTAQFTFATAGPSVFIALPTDNTDIFTATPVVGWVATNQAQYRVQVFNQGKYTPIYDTDWVINSVQNALVVPAGYLKVGKEYDFQVSIKDAGALVTDAKVTYVFLNYIAPADVTGFNGAPVAIYTDPWPTGVRLEWEESTVDDDLFRGYYIFRDDLEDLPIAFISSKNRVSFVDAVPVSGRDNIYTIYVAVLQTTSVVELFSVGVSTVAGVTLKGVVICSVERPSRLRAVMTRVNERSVERIGNETVYQPWGAIQARPGTLAAPTTVKGKARYSQITGNFLLAGDAQADGAQRRRELEALDAANDTVCYRDDLGRKLFGTIPAEGGLIITDQRLGRSLVDMVIRQENYEEGIYRPSGA
jgi:hypothetical protein